MPSTTDTRRAMRRRGLRLSTRPPCSPRVGVEAERGACAGPTGSFSLTACVPDPVPDPDPCTLHIKQYKIRTLCI